MKAAWFDAFGPAAEVLQVGEQPKPEAGAGEVLVRLHTSGVNPSDVKKRAGAFPNLLDDGLVIPHSDGAGVIEAVGAGVPPSRVGERVGFLLLMIPDPSRGDLKWLRSDQMEWPS